MGQGYWAGLGGTGAHRTNATVYETRVDLKEALMKTCRMAENWFRVGTSEGLADHSDLQVPVEDDILIPHGQGP